MSSNEIFYVCIGLLSIVLTIYPNRHLFTARAGGVAALEAVYYLTALAALLVGWYFNFQYMRTYGSEATWANWTKLLFVNPASASGGQDLLFANVVLFPLWTFADGRRSGMKWNWIWFPMSALTSFAFAMALYLALRERQLHWNRAARQL
jgi:hypothetical protein